MINFFPSSSLLSFGLLNFLFHLLVYQTLLKFHWRSFQAASFFSTVVLRGFTTVSGKFLSAKIPKRHKPQRKLLSKRGSCSDSNKLNLKCLHDEKVFSNDSLLTLPFWAAASVSNFFSSTGFRCEFPLSSNGTPYVRQLSTTTLLLSFAIKKDKSNFLVVKHFTKKISFLIRAAIDWTCTFDFILSYNRRYKHGSGYLLCGFVVNNIRVLQ